VREPASFEPWLNGTEMIESYGECYVKTVMHLFAALPKALEWLIPVGLADVSSPSQEEGIHSNSRKLALPKAAKEPN
jgi:hypothetical protein